MKFTIGMTGDSINSSCIKNMKSNRVSISPVSTRGFRRRFETAEKPPKSAMKDDKAPGTVSRSIHFADEDDNRDSIVTGSYHFMPSDYMDDENNGTTTPVKEPTQTPSTARTSTHSKSFADPSPFGAALTPLGYDWGRQLGFSPSNSVGGSFTPFRSPGLAMSLRKSARKADRTPLMDLSTNVVPKSTSMKENVVTKRSAGDESSNIPSPKRQRLDETKRSALFADEEQ
jgi:hypothetical protein